MPLIAHYPLSSSADDSSGNGHDGAATGVSYVAGKIGQAASFGGSGYVAVSRFSQPATATYTMWAKATTRGSFMGLLSQRGNGAGDFVIRLGSAADDGHLSFIRWNGISNNYKTWTTASLVVPLNTWSFIAVVVESETVVRCVLNGVTEYPSYSSGTSTQSDVPFYIGAQNSICFNGLIDDVRVYDEAMEDWKIASIFNSGAGSEQCEPWQRLILPAVRQTIRSLRAA